MVIPRGQKKEGSSPGRFPGRHALKIYGFIYEKRALRLIKEKCSNKDVRQFVIHVF